MGNSAKCSTFTRFVNCIDNRQNQLLNHVLDNKNRYNDYVEYLICAKTTVDVKNGETECKLTWEIITKTIVPSMAS